MAVKNSLTNEMLRSKFDNSFNLVNYAISLAKKMMNRGEEFQTNPANIVLEKIVNGQDKVYSEEFDEDFDDEEDDDEMV